MNAQTKNRNLASKASEELFEFTLIALAPKVYNLAYYLTQSYHTAEIVLQKTFSSAWADYLDTNTVSKKDIIIYAITYAYKAWQVSSLSDSIEVETHKGLNLQTLPKAIALLPWKYRVAFILRDVLRLSDTDCAQILEQGLEATQEQIHHARMLLVELSREEEKEESRDLSYEEKLNEFLIGL